LGRGDTYEAREHAYVDGNPYIYAKTYRDGDGYPYIDIDADIN